jgi:hypothetical protein
LRLARVPNSHVGRGRSWTIAASDYAKDYPELAVELMEAVVVGGDYVARGEEGDLPEMLSSTFSELMANHPEALAVAGRAVVRVRREPAAPRASRGGETPPRPYHRRSPSSPSMASREIRSRVSSNSLISSRVRRW